MQEKKGQNTIRHIENSTRTEVSLSLSVVISIVNGLNSPIKREQLGEWIKTHDPTICSLKRLTKIQTHKLVESERKEISYANSNPKRQRWLYWTNTD